MSRLRFDEALFGELGPRIYVALCSETRHPLTTAKFRIRRANGVTDEELFEDAMRVRPAGPLGL